MFHLSTYGDGYKPRTLENAKLGTITLAFAVDFTSAGERLTHKAAGDRYYGVPLDGATKKHVKEFCAKLKDTRPEGIFKIGKPTINIAGNGLYTLFKHWGKGAQGRCDQVVLRFLMEVQERIGEFAVRSGGQTGVDESGIRTALWMELDATALLPNGYLMRDYQGFDNKFTMLDTIQRLTTMTTYNAGIGVAK